MASNDLNLTLGKGKLFFGEFAAGTQNPKGERFIGNSSEITVNADVQTIEHRSSTEGRMKKDFEAITGVDRAGTIVTDNMGLDNVGIFALGYVERVSVSSATGTEQTFVDVEQGLTYQLGVTAAKPEGVRKLASVVVEVGVTVKTLGTDYTVDLERGRITIVVGGTIANLADIDVTYNTTAHSIDRVVAGATKKEGSLRWVAANPDGPVTDYFFPWVKLGPNGDLSLVSAEEFINLPLAIEVLEKGDLAPWIATSQPITV